MKAIEDRSGNVIGTTNVEHYVYEFPEYKEIRSSVSGSETTESVYVYYTNTDTGKTVTCRFSNHGNNGVKFGMQLDGRGATKDEILFGLGLKKRTFVPNVRLFIGTQQVAKKKMADYEESTLTIREMYALGKDADLSAHVGKLAKGSNYVVFDSAVKEVVCSEGHYIYE